MDFGLSKYQRTMYPEYTQRVPLIKTLMFDVQPCDR